MRSIVEIIEIEKKLRREIVEKAKTLRDLASLSNIRDDKYSQTLNSIIQNL